MVTNKKEEDKPVRKIWAKIQTGYFLTGIQILVFAIFIFITIGMVFARGVCCGDDGFHAHVAKNLADGLGYSSTLPLSQAHYSITVFDPLIGTGPTIILPTALMIKLVGNTYWAPGLTEVLLWGSLLFFIGFVLNKLFKNKVGLTIVTIIFLYFAYTFMAYQYEMWYALYGEIPAVMLIVLAILIWFLPYSKVNLLISGLLFSLAYESKLISLMPFSIFLFFVALYKFIENKKNIKASFKSIVNTFFYIALGFGIPIFLYEVWKLLTIHPYAYLQWWKDYLRYVLDFGVNSDQNLGLRIIERINFAEQRFGVFLPIFFVIFAGIGFAIRKQKKLFYIFIIFVSIISIYTIYWLIFSLGWARYLLIPLVMIIFVLTIPYIDNDLKIHYKIIYTLILVGLSIFNINTIDVNHQMSILQLYKPSTTTIAQQEVANILSAELDKRPFYTQWWANAVDLEYIMDSHLNFSTIWDPALDFKKPIIVVVNNNMLYEQVEGLTELLSKCKIREIVNYTYAECPALYSP